MSREARPVLSACCSSGYCVRSAIVAVWKPRALLFKALLGSKRRLMESMESLCVMLAHAPNCLQKQRC